MSRSFMYPILVTILLFATRSNLLANLSSLSRNDPYPVFTALDPQDFLLTKAKLRVLDPVYSQMKNNGVSLSLSAFGQNACQGKNLAGNGWFGTNSVTIGCPGTNTTQTVCGYPIELGDLPAGCFFPGGRWSMIGMLFGALPQGESLPNALEEALAVLYPGQAPGTVESPQDIDFEQELLGFFTVPLEYRKRGVRVELEGNLFGGLGFRLQTGIVSMSQTVTQFVDLNCLAHYNKCRFPRFQPDDTDPTTSEEFTEFQDNVEEYLMKQLKVIATEIGVDICDFVQLSVEEIRMNVFWREIFELNRQRLDWPHFLLIPFLEFGGSFSPGKKKDASKQFSLGFGNNGHTSVGGTAGIMIDFLETVEVGGEVGITHFFSRDYKCFRVPNSKCQSGLFPFATDVHISPGLNWHFGAKLAAYQFLDRLSFWFEYVQVEHKQDKICLIKPDEAFVPGVLEDLSGFRVKLGNFGFTYDISPNIGLGFLWQAPFGQHNAYKSSTIMGTFYTTF